MTVTVTTLDADVVTYGYDPCHRQGVTEFYRELLVNGEIAGLVIDGEIIS
jgi:hypothetical protein